MAISLGFGVLFATLITLVFIPASHLALRDIANLVRGLFLPQPPASESSRCNRALCDRVKFDPRRHQEAIFTLRQLNFSIVCRAN